MADPAHAQMRKPDVEPPVLGPADQEQANPKGADAPSFEGERRLSHGGTVLLGEAVVGSAHEHPFPLPLNLDRRGRPATVQMTVADEQFRLSLPEVELESVHGALAAQKPPRTTVMFKPKHPGRASAVAQLNATWEDGHSEQLEVMIFGAARNLEDPVGSSTADARPKQAPPKRVEDTRPPSLALFEERASQLTNHVDAIIERQREGVQIINDEAKSYAAAPPPKPAWMLLAELAVTMGTAGVAAIAAKYVSDKFMGLLATEAEHLESAAAKKTGQAVANAEQGAAHAGGNAATHAPIAGEHAASAGEHAAADAAAHTTSAGEHGAEKHGKGGSHLVGEGLTASIEDALKENGKPKLSEPAEAKEGGEDEEAASASPMINFFSVQRTALSESTTEKKDAMAGVIGGLRAAAQADPAGAVAAITAIRGGLDAGRIGAERQQASATATQWVSFVAQGKHGTTMKPSPGKQGEQAVTRTADLREDQTVYGPLKQAAPDTGGVLEIWVGIDASLGVRVWNAQLHGVSRLIGDRMLKMKLAEAKVPVRIRSSATDVITIDESGDVQTHGTRQLEPDVSGEATGAQAQNNDAARKIVATVFSKTLSQWGISHIASDDKAK